MAARALAGKTLFITGASRGIGKAIALRAARDGANIVIAAKTAEAHPKLPGTIYTAAEEIEKAGGKCLPCIVDIRFEDQVLKAVREGAEKFGGIDILVNNASAIQLTGTDATDMKKFDLMMGINGRGTFLCSKACLPYLKKGKNSHILNISPPLSMRARWFKDHTAYTMAKYGMSMCVLGMSEEFKPDGIAVNALWPRTAIITAAMEMLGGAEVGKNCRKPEIMADAAYVILTKPSREFTGQFCIDDEILKKAGVTDMDQYAVVKGATLLPDFFLDDDVTDAEALFAELKTKGPSKPSANTSTKASSGASNAGSGSVAKVFDNIKTMLSPELFDSVKATYQFELKGNEAGFWFLDLKNAPGKVESRSASGDADCKMTLSSDDFLSLFAGKLKATEAFFGGKLKISGNMGAAMKLEKLMKKVAAAKPAAAAAAPKQDAAPAAGAAAGGAVAKVFDSIKTSIASDLIDSVKASYQFELKGSEPGTWYLDLKNAPGKVENKAVDGADCKMTLSSEDFLALFAGKLKATDAFFGGKLKISGNMGAAMKLEKVMKKVAAGRAKL